MEQVQQHGSLQLAPALCSKVLGNALWWVPGSRLDASHSHRYHHGRLQRAESGLDSAEPLRNLKVETFLTQIQAFSGGKQMPTALPALLSCNKTTGCAKNGRAWGGKHSPAAMLEHRYSRVELRGRGGLKGFGEISNQRAAEQRCQAVLC